MQATRLKNRFYEFTSLDFVDTVRNGNWNDENPLRSLFSLPLDFNLPYVQLCDSYKGEFPSDVYSQENLNVEDHWSINFLLQITTIRILYTQKKVW